ncbi:MAG TPA: M28 family peptidase [Burkholderiales bacterium]|nr:M28 family peptidase [Burkholderiales bacterium]
MRREAESRHSKGVAVEPVTGHWSPVTPFGIARMLFWLAFALGVAALLWYMVVVPDKPYSGVPGALTPEEKSLADSLRRHVDAVASSEHNVINKPAGLEAAARHIELTLYGFGYRVEAQRFQVDRDEARNVEAEVSGGVRAGEIVVVGAHYDSALGAPGANDNGSGVAALLELARILRGSKPVRTLRFVAFVNEEQPFYRGDAMGSRQYARRCRERGENIVAMLSLETIGYYSDRPGSQRYPFPLGFFYPSTGNFVAFVSNLSSRGLLHEAIASFRRHAALPSEGVAAPAFIPGVDWSDHWSFWQEGYPALMVTDTAPYRYPHYHTAQDTPDKVNYEALARVVKGLEGMLRDLAGELKRN